MIVNLWVSWMSILDKKTKTPRKTQKNNKLKMLNIKMSIKGGAVFIFILPGGPLPSVSYATGHDACVWSRRNDDGQARNQRGETGQLPPNRAIATPEIFKNIFSC